MLQHHFILADTPCYSGGKKSRQVDENTAATLSFDVNFELGRYTAATILLKKLKRDNDYSYYFRRSKLDHFNGTIDSAIKSMLKAAITW